MKKQELFDKYSIDESHNVWESIDSLMSVEVYRVCLLYTSDAADERSSVDLGGRPIIKKKKTYNH